ncbi:4-galactosyl-N-acetylglucosaminide 3-alpha-L-fucosyltransferase 9-like [Tachypleus tridentatus]|uniref:4-galactosyl-N-acetylglucosaminide 3-alpha-L-fucosyltransferase 9-like n=1 Tax=Tachypleus tridentatus TaxID=6853 RepID=UPI003FD0BA8B
MCTFLNTSKMRIFLLLCGISCFVFLWTLHFLTSRFVEVKFNHVFEDSNFVRVFQHKARQFFTKRLHHGDKEKHAVCPTVSTEIEVVKQSRKVVIPEGNLKKGNNYKIIFLWTKYFSSNYSEDFYFFRPGNETFVRYGCSNLCEVTREKRLLSSVDAVLFHARDLNMKDLPKIREPHQRWILYGLESPSLTNLPWKSINGLFNWTMTYRENSDIQARYGYTCKKQSLGKNEIRDYFKIKSREVVWFVSNCHTSSKREKYVRELAKFIPVDIYGNCGKKKCIPSQSSRCYENILNKYKFYLSFENSICKDYITEKFFNILNYDIVPITFGGAKYEHFIPTNSFINALNFPDPRDLAKLLKKIGSNGTLYNEFFRWKTNYKVYLHRWMCELCEKLHEDTTPTVRYNLKEWFVKEANCLSWNYTSKTFLPLKL